jgi:hypothetical protein
MANLFNLLRKKRFDQYNQAMQQSPVIPLTHWRNTWGDEQSKMEHLLRAANPDTLSLAPRGGEVFGDPWRGLDSAQGPLLSARMVDGDIVDNPAWGSSMLGESSTDALLPNIEVTQDKRPPAPMIPVPNEPFDQPQKEKGLDAEGMLKALEKHESAGPAGWASMGKPGGTGGGGFKLFPNSMVENMASSGPLDLEQQKKDWWERYLRSIA